MLMRFAAMLVVARLACGQAPPYADPPFDFTRVLFSAAFSDDMVLQRAPARASVLGTATPGASITVRVTGPANFTWTSAPSAVTSAPSDASLHGTWKALLPARAAGFGYEIQALCDGCPTATAASLVGVGFGDVVLCSGQVRTPCCSLRCPRCWSPFSPNQHAPPHARTHFAEQHGVPPADHAVAL